MSEQGLALKYRPRELEDIVGQPQVIVPLVEQAHEGRIRQAYLFVGVRGTGKTTTARALAKVCNCANPSHGAPCNDCDSCRGIDKGDDIDVLEIDGASNNGVADARDLKDQMQYLPMRAKNYKIFIIDEAHMLTKQAWNALLKATEEPPKHVKFMFCTTEMGKVPSTIVDRCQEFHFHVLSDKAIRERLEFVIGQEDITHDDDGLHQLVEMAKGSMRRALTLLDQVGTVATLDKVQAIWGRPTASQVDKLLIAISKGQTALVYAQSQKLLKRGFTEYGVANALITSLGNLLEIRSHKPDSLIAVSEIIVELEALVRFIRSSDTPREVFMAKVLRITAERLKRDEHKTTNID